MAKSYFEDYDARMVFKENLRRIMDDRGLDQATIAARLGRAKSVVSDWYNGKKYPRIDAMQDLAAICNVSVDELISRQEDIWHSKLVRAYERASMSQRVEASKALGVHYIRVYDDRELVFNTRHFLSQALDGNIPLSEVSDVINAEFLKSQNSRWKSCTIEIYNLCMLAITSGDISILDGAQFDDDLSVQKSLDGDSSENDYAMSTIFRITGNREIPVFDRETLEKREVQLLSDSSATTAE